MVAQNLLIDNDSFISTQVLQEFTNISRKKHKVEWKKVSAALEEIISHTSVFTNQIQTIKHALLIAEKTKYTF